MQSPSSHPCCGSTMHCSRLMLCFSSPSIYSDALFKLPTSSSSSLMLPQKLGYPTTSFSVPLIILHNYIINCVSSLQSESHCQDSWVDECGAALCHICGDILCIRGDDSSTSGWMDLCGSLRMCLRSSLEHHCK